MSFVVVKPLILVLGWKLPKNQYATIRAELNRLGALAVMVDAYQAIVHTPDTAEVFGPEHVAAWATKADGLMVYPEVVEDKKGRAVLGACRDAASRPSARWPQGRAIEEVPVLHLGSELGADRTAAWIDSWIARNDPQTLMEAKARLEARAASSRAESDYPFAWTAADQLQLRNCTTGELGPAIVSGPGGLDLSVCRNASDAALDRRTLTERVLACFEAYRQRMNRLVAEREGAGL